MIAEIMSMTHIMSTSGIQLRAMRRCRGVWLCVGDRWPVTGETVRR